MALLNITEFDAMDVNGRGKEPAITTQSITYTTSASGAPWNQRTRFIRCHPDAAAHVRFGPGSLTAVVADTRIGANEERYFEVVRAAGEHLAVYDGST